MLGIGIAKGDFHTVTFAESGLNVECGGSGQVELDGEVESLIVEGGAGLPCGGADAIACRVASERDRAGLVLPWPFRGLAVDLDGGGQLRRTHRGVLRSSDDDGGNSLLAALLDLRLGRGIAVEEEISPANGILPQTFLCYLHHQRTGFNGVVGDDELAAGLVAFPQFESAGFGFVEAGDVIADEPVLPGDHHGADNAFGRASGDDVVAEK